jgi:hypothetical protein
LLPSWTYRKEYEDLDEDLRDHLIAYHICNEDCITKDEEKIENAVYE